MQCLYCETELKAFRGLFDEDFCCREHREKYFSSFRKAVNSLPDAVLPPAAETDETAAPPIVIDIVTDAETHVAQEMVDVKALPVAADPRVADFTKTQVTPAGGSEAWISTPQCAFAASALEIPVQNTPLESAVAAEERPAMLIEPLAMAAACSHGVVVPLEFARSHPVQMEQAAVEPAALEMAPVAEVAISADIQVLKHADGPTALRGALAIPAFRASLESEAGVLPVAEAAELPLNSVQLASSPVACGEIAFAFAVAEPAFNASREAMELNGPIAVIQPDPEVAPAVALNAIPAASPAPAPALAAQMLPPALALHSQQNTAPAQPAGFSSMLSPVAPSGIPASEEAANQPAEPRTHAPMRVAFGNLVRIKNWRLKITFAKPA